MEPSALRTKADVRRHIQIVRGPVCRLDRAGAADQAGEGAEAAADAVGDEVDEPVLEHQHQIAALAAEMRGRQHTRACRRDQMGDAERRAQQTGAFERGGVSNSQVTGGWFSSLRPA